MDNREKMPCFDPEEALFLTNKWDAVNSDSSSDDEEKCEIKNQNTRTWKTIINKLTHGWVLIDLKNVFSVSLQQVNILCLTTIIPLLYGVLSGSLENT